MKKIRNGLCHCPPFSLPLENSCRAGNTGVASPDSLKSGKVDMKDYVLKEKPEPASNEMVWAFDLGHPLRLERRFLRSREREKVAQPDEGRWGETIQCGAGRGEVSNSGNQKTAVRRGNEFLHKASLLIPAEFAETKTAAFPGLTRYQ
jgi:hypothetical protein